MTKKHFIELANALRKTMPRPSDGPLMDQWNVDVYAVARVLASFNPRFDSGLWLTYISGGCGPSGGSVKS